MLRLPALDLWPPGAIPHPYARAEKADRSSPSLRLIEEDDNQKVKLLWNLHRLLRPRHKVDKGLQRLVREPLEEAWVEVVRAQRRGPPESAAGFAHLLGRGPP